MRKVFLLFCTLVSIIVTKAQEGFPDLTFSNTGSVATVFNNPSFTPSSIAFDNSGGLVGAKSFGTSVVVIRYKPDGTIDNSFNGGMAITTFKQYTSLFVSHVVVRNDGKIIVAVSGRGELLFPNFGQRVFTLIRYNNDGTLDPTFGTGGFAQEDINDRVSYPFLAIQSDGKFVAARQVIGPGGRSFGITRYNANGSVAGGGGVPLPFITIPPSTTPQFIDRSMVSSLLIQPDDKVILTAFAFPSFTPSTFNIIERLNPNGTPDATFGKNGIIITMESIGGSPVAVESTGKIIMQLGNRLSRINNDGTPDPSFGSGGFIQSPFTISKVILQKDGKIITAGNYTEAGSIGNVMLARYNPNGTFDPTFGYGGIMVTPTGASQGTVTNIDMVIAGNRLYTYHSGIETVYQLSSPSMLVSNQATTRQEKAILEKQQVTSMLNVLASPNPATAYFNLRLQSSSREMMQVRIIDAFGRIIEVIRNVAPNTSITVGTGYRAGIYFAEVIQGSNKVITKVIKQ